MLDYIVQAPKYVEPIERIFPYALETYPLTKLDDNPVTRLHYHSVYELGICANGHGKCIFMDDSVSYTAGDATFFVPYQAHFSRCNPESLSEWYWFYFDLDATFSMQGFLPEYWRSLGEMSFEKSGVLHHTEHSHLCQLIADIIRTANNLSMPNRNITISLLLAQFLVEATRDIKDNNPIKNANNDNPIMRILPAIKYIRQHYGEQLNAESLAKLCNMSQSTFRRCFHGAMNMSPYDYIMNLRMKMAAHYLANSKMNIADIAQNCGIKDSSNFIHQFEQKFKTAPKQFRKEHSQ